MNHKKRESPTISGKPEVEKPNTLFSVIHTWIETQTSITVRRLRFLSFFGFLLIIVASVAVTYVALQRQRDDALVINMAGRQRMLIQKMTLEVLGVQADAGPYYREQLRNTESVFFEQTLAALIAGGEVPYDEATSVILPPTRSPQILAELDTVRATWGKMDPAIHTVLMAEPHSAELDEAVDTVARLSPVILSQMDKVVHLYEAEAAHKVTRLQGIQIIFLIAAIVLLIVVMVFTEGNVLRPLDRLGGAAQRIGEGDLDTPVSVNGLGEIDRLVRSFENMRQNLASSRTESERHAHKQAQLLNLSNALLSESEPQAIMDLAVRIASEMLEVEFASIAYMDSTGQIYCGQACVGWTPEMLQLGQRTPLDSNNGVDYAIRNRTTVIIPDETCEKRFGAPSWIAQMGIVSSLIVPLIAGEEVIGGLVLNSRDHRDWKDSSVRLVSLIANSTAQALQRARLYTTAQERLERISALHDIDIAITSSLDLNKRLDTLLEKVTERLQVDAAAVALICPDTHELVYAARRGLDGEFFANGLLKVKEGIAGQVAQSGEAAAIPDVSAEPRFVRRSIAERLGIVSYLAVPLKVRSAIIGVLELATRERHKFLSEEVDFFVTLAGQAAIAIENARLFDETRRRAAQQGRLAETASAILSTLQGEALWPTVTTAVRETLNADRAAIHLYDRANERLTCPHASGLSLEYVTEINRRFREVSGENLLSHPQPILIGNAQTDLVDASFHDLATREGFHSCAIFPLVKHDITLGALVAYRDLVAPFSPNDISAGSTLAHIVSVAMQNTQLFESESAARERAETLQQVGALLTTQLSLDRVFDKLFDLLARVVTYDSVSVQLMDDEGNMYLGNGRGFPDIDLDWKAVEEVQKMEMEKRIWAEGRPLVIPDTHADSDWVIVPGLEYIHSWVGAPLLVKGELIGILNVDNKDAGAYDQATGEIVMAFANQAAVAIKNARLFESARQQLNELVILNEVAAAAAESISENELIERTTKIIGNSLYPDDFGILLVDNAAGALRFHPSYWGKWSEDTAKHTVIPLGRGVTGRVAINGQPCRVPDIALEPAYLDVGLAEGMRSELCVPLKISEKVIGVINTESKRADAFSKTDERFLTTLAGQLATGIERARLLEGLIGEQHNLELLYHLSLELAADLDPGQVARHALQVAINVLGVSRGNILTIENDNEHMRLLAVTGYDRETVGAINQRLNWNTSQGVTGRAVQTHTPIIVPDVSKNPYWIPIPGLDDWVKSIVSVPLIAGNDVVGVLNLLSEETDFFKIENLSLITAIASPVALALQNARLYDSLRQRLAELEMVANISAAMRKAQSQNDMQDILLAKAVEGLQANAGVLLLLDHNELKFANTHGATGVSLGATCPPNAGMMWQALKSSRPYFIPDVRQIEELHESTICQALMGDALSCACVPLQTTASTIGVVFLNWKNKPFLSTDESRLLESLSEIAANAIHRSSLHLQTIQQAQDLLQAYDATIEGWSHALDLRDKETEDHTLRVTNLTLQLAQAFGMNESQLDHIRRGALLHDIGKMGVPDHILHKAGALSDEEWTIMRRHPQLAYEMLSPIAYLQPAMDIPYCHHEKWDGTGYPRGLKGEEIPLAARIFAVVDVFDALTSNRPYRPAWKKRKALDYIREQAGTHFDPQAVELFFMVLKENA